MLSVNTALDGLLKFASGVRVRLVALPLALRRPREILSEYGNLREQEGRGALLREHHHGGRRGDGPCRPGAGELGGR